MGLIPQFTKAQIDRHIRAFMLRVERATINTLAYLGEECVTKARDLRTYRDVTGNLRNSIGYVIVANGRIVRRSFKRSATVIVTGEAGQSRRTRGSADGTVYGQLLAEDLAQHYSTGYVLLVVAGMNYAQQVESRGLDVLTSAEHYAEQALPGMLRQLAADIDTTGKQLPL